MAHYVISSRILLVKLHCKPFNITLIQVYAPTSTGSVEYINEFYDDLEVAYKHYKSQDMIIVTANQRWMTNEILDMMEERRLIKHNRGLYRQKDAEIQIPHITPDTAGIPITSEEIQHAVKRMPLVLTLCQRNASCRWRVWAGRAYQVYKYGVLPCLFPEELNKSIFITLPKISGTTKCETISLMSHITKLILPVVMNRVRGRTLQEIAQVQYGFMHDKGTRNAIFVLRRMSERAMRSKRTYMHVSLITANHLIQ